MSSCNLLNLGKLQVPFFYIDKAGLPGPQGDAGTNGRTILSGSVNPTTEGDNGDFYINTSTSTLFGPKASGAWPSGVSLIGPQGALVIYSDTTPFSSASYTNTFVTAATYSLASSYIAQDGDTIEIDAQGYIPGTSFVFNLLGNTPHIRQGLFSFAWGIDYVYQSYTMQSQMNQVAPSVEMRFDFSFNIKLTRSAGDIFYSLSHLGSIRAFNVISGTTIPTGQLPYTTNGLFALSDPSVPQTLTLSIKNQNSNIPSAAQIVLSSFIVKAYNAI